MTRSAQYAELVRTLEQQDSRYVAATALCGAPWLPRFLVQTATLYHQPSTRRLALRGMRVLFRVLGGRRPGRPKAKPLSPPQRTAASAVMATWRAEVDARWGLDRSQLPGALLSSSPSFEPTLAQERALRELMRRPRLRKSDIVLTLTSWQTGVPLRRLRAAPEIASLIYA